MSAPNTNRILTTLNAPLTITSILIDAQGNPVEQATFVGFPLGTTNNGTDGELGGKVIIIGDRAAAVNNPSTATTTQVNASATSVSLLASNPARKGASIFNTGSSTLHLSYTATATAAATAVDIVTGAYFEVPFGYTGAIAGIWDGSPSGKANINEF